MLTVSMFCDQKSGANDFAGSVRGIQIECPALALHRNELFESQSNGFPVLSLTHTHTHRETNLTLVQ